MKKINELKSRLTKLEAKQAPAPRVVVRYADQITAEERAELGSDPTVTLVIIEYANKEKQND